MGRKLTFAEAVNEAMFQAMEMDKSVICYGLGVDDPKGVYSTTLGLQEKFGKERVFDIPSSENAMTGVAIGAGLRGFRSVMTHQRLDFFLLAMDQLVNGAAKWHYMFGGQNNVPITIRLIIGRGWGQGPTHSQSLQSWFAHIPGLKVVMPALTKDAKGLLLSSIFDDNPVIFLEPRWLHNQQGEVPEGDYRTPLGMANVIKQGSEISVISMSYMTVEALHVVDYLDKHDISCELIDLRTVAPIDWDMIFQSVKKTGRILVLDTGSTTGSIAGEIIARVAIELFDDLHCAPRRIGLPDFPSPTSPALTKGFYPDAVSIAEQIVTMLNVDVNCDELSDKTMPHDVPGDWFKGPF